MLKVKFWRIENTLFMQVLEQGEEINREYFRYKTSNNIEIISCRFPQIGQNFLGNIDENMLYIRGENCDRDNDIVAHTFNSVTIAKCFLKDYVDAIKEYNDSLLPQKLEDTEKDIEVVIVG